MESTVLKNRILKPNCNFHWFSEFKKAEAKAPVRTRGSTIRSLRINFRRSNVPGKLKNCGLQGDQPAALSPAIVEVGMDHIKEDSDNGPPAERLTPAERSRIRRHEHELAKAQKAAEEAAAKEEEMAILKRAAKHELEEKKRGRTLLGLEGYWRPSTVLKADTRYH
jgi:hypothetical protein